jgi:hypothetical protein
LNAVGNTIETLRFNETFINAERTHTMSSTIIPLEVESEVLFYLCGALIVHQKIAVVLRS